MARWLPMAAILGLVAFAPIADGQESGSDDVVPGVPFAEGDVISFDQLDKLKDYLPPEFWENREYFFYEGMKLQIGPAYRDYGSADAYMVEYRQLNQEHEEELGRLLTQRELADFLIRTSMAGKALSR